MPLLNFISPINKSADLEEGINSDTFNPSLDPEEHDIPQ